MTVTADTRVALTFFSDYAAATKREQGVRLGDLAELIRATTANDKGSLPWLKMARFGAARTAKGSLRHDRNVLAITGIEVDYDAEKIACERAVEIVEKAGLGCLVYTSPSHIPERPRWRVLCPTSTELPPARRAGWVSCLNGLFGGVFAGESWTVSQSYYYGSVNGKPGHCVHVVDGAAIDELDELAKIAIGKPATKTRDRAAGEPPGEVDEEAHLELIRTGAAYHSAAIRLLGAWAWNGVALLDAERRLRDAFDAVFPPDRDQRWHARVAEIPTLLRYVYCKDAGKRDARAAQFEADDAGFDARQPPPEAEGGAAGEGVTFADFHAYMPQHSYIFAPAREPWPAASVNARLGRVQISTDANGDPVTISAATWLDRNKAVEQMSWAPGLPLVIEDRLIAEGGWIERRGVRCLNLYRPSLLPLGDPMQAGRWRAHVEHVYPEDAPHIIAWLAHRVQHPDDKVNHILVLGGTQGIGKDTLIEPVKRAVGPWNVAEPSPVQLVGRFNGFAKSVILRINEAHDLGDIDRYQFYEHLKVYAAAPPDVLRVDEKHLREHNVPNVCGVLITTNHKTDGIYLPADDRRHYVAWSARKKEEYDDNYWSELWGWYDRGGDRHVAAYLATLDLAAFNPKAPPPKTGAFWDIVNTNRAPEDAELADVLDRLHEPDAVTLARVVSFADEDFAVWLKDRRNRRAIPHRFENCGYVATRNPDAEDGRWVVGGRRIIVYTKSSLVLRDQLAAVSKLLNRPSGP